MISIDYTKKYALAVSGGIDSMVMLHLFASLKPRPNFFVVTVNHNMRENAQHDCDFVASYCKTLKVTCKTFSVDVPTYCEVMKVSDETGARTLRYGVFNSLDCDFVCLAHNANDNAETVLMHVCRGSGAHGAEGIRKQNGNLLRPILDMTRSEIESYAQKNNVPCVIDSTNSDIKYARNYIRHEVLPRLANVNENVVVNINRFAQNMADDNAYLDSLADISTVVFTQKRAEVPVKLLKQPKPIAFRVLRKVFERLGFWYNIEKLHFDALVELASADGGKKLSLPFDLEAVNDYDKITIRQKRETAIHTFAIPFAVGTTDTPVGTLVVSKQKTDNALKIDVAKLPADAVIRTRKTGDVFKKFGGGTKPLGRYLIDKKIPSRRRDELLLVASGNNVYVICGVEISDTVKTDEGSDVYYVTVK